jgi:phosphoribosylformylglycinamidine (FGAM) synthase PurS component
VSQMVALTVRLKITDNEAFSALEALHAKMGLADVVADLVREDRWELDVDAASADDARSIVERAISSTTVFLNPNKHSYAIAPAAADGEDLDPNEVAVVVTDRAGADSPRALAAVARVGIPGIRSARRSTRWRIRLIQRPQPGHPETLELIRRIGVTTGRDAGLLANPHSQSAVAVLPWGEQKPLVG